MSEKRMTPSGWNASQGLQGDLDGEVDGLGALAEGGVLLAQVLVDLHVATRLAHHPDGGALDVLAADGAEHEGV